VQTTRRFASPHVAFTLARRLVRFSAATVILGRDRDSRHDAAQTSRKGSQMPIGGFGPIGLQFPLKTETPFAGFTPAFSSVKPMVAGYGGAANCMSSQRTTICRCHLPLRKTRPAVAVLHSLVYSA